MSVSSTSTAAGACATALGLNSWWMVSKVHRAWGSDLVVATAARGRSTAGAVLFLAALVGTLGVAWPEAAGAATVRVSAGETLSQIAHTYGTTTSQVAAANDITDPNKIEAGTVLQIPTSGSGASTGSASVGSTSVAVRPGESLWGIATRFGTTVSALAAANGIVNTAHVLIGRRGGDSERPPPIRRRGCVGERVRRSRGEVLLLDIPVRSQVGRICTK